MEISFGNLLFILILVLFLCQFIIRKQHPPGPLGFPFIGQLPFQILEKIYAIFLPEKSHRNYFKEMKQKYGDIWSIDLCGKRLVVLASVEVITEAFLDNAKLFSGRPIQESLKVFSQDRGIIFTDGKLAQDNRQLSVKALRDLGMGKKLLEGKISNEVHELIETIEKNLSKPISSPDIFVKAVSNVICLLSFDVRNKYNDPEFERYIKNLKVIGHSNSAHEILELLGKILDRKYLMMIFPVIKRFVTSNQEAMEFVADKCKSRIKVEAEFSKPSCVFDFFWRYRYQDLPEIYQNERFLNISHSMFDILFGGTDNTTNMLGYCCLILGYHQDVQKELREEIQSFVDDHTLINMEMRKDFQKLLSFIDEAQRYSYLAPILMHRVLKTCIFKGYRIEDTDIVYADLGTIMQDPKIFENPNDFNLYRFMDESRTKYVPPKSFFPFGLGKRSCLGEGIATMELFLFLSKIIQRFHISLPRETEIKYLKIIEGSSGLFHAPLDHEIIFKIVHS